MSFRKRIQVWNQLFKENGCYNIFKLHHRWYYRWRAKEMSNEEDLYRFLKPLELYTLWDRILVLLRLKIWFWNVHNSRTLPYAVSSQIFSQVKRQQKTTGGSLRPHETKVYFSEKYVLLRKFKYFLILGNQISQATSPSSISLNGTAACEIGTTTNLLVACSCRVLAFTKFQWCFLSRYTRLIKSLRARRSFTLHGLTFYRVSLLTWINWIIDRP